MFTIISLIQSILKQRQGDPTVLDNAPWAVIQGCPHKPNAHHSGKLDRGNKCEDHLYLKSQRRSLEEMTFTLNSEENNRVTKLTGEDTSHREGMEVWKQDLPCLKWT